MKKICLILLSFSFCATLLAQDERFSGGIMLGPVTSQVSGDGLGGWDKFGFTAGAWVRLNLSEKWGAMMCMQYIMKGSAKQANESIGDYNTFSYRLNYIDVPVMAEYRIKKWVFHLGLYGGVLVHQEQKNNGSFSEIRPPFKSSDIGSNIGAGYYLGDKLWIEMRGQSSLIPTRVPPDGVAVGTYYRAGNYNQVLQLLFNYAF